MSEPQGKQNDFELISDSEEIHRIFTDGSKANAPSELWVTEYQNVTKSHLGVYIQEEKSFYISAPANFNLQTFQQELTQAGTKECFLGITLPKAHLFFKSQLITLDAAGLKFSTPGKLFRLQRRKNIRFPIPEGYLLKVEFQDPLFPEVRVQKRVFDISASGLSFLTSENDAPTYAEGLIVSQAQFSLRGKAMTTDFEVRYCRLLSEKDKIKEPTYKIGVAFKTLGSAESAFIASYVLDESRKYFSRLL